MKNLFLILPICALFVGETLIGHPIGARSLALDKNVKVEQRYLKTQSGYELLSLSSAQVSQLINTYANDGKVILYEKIPDEKGEPSYRIADSVTLPTGARCILILALGGGGDDAYLVFDDKFLDAEYNKWLMINTASKPVGFRVGKNEKPLLIEENRSEIYKVDAAEGAGVAVLGQAKWNGKEKTFYSTYWSVREGERSIVIFVERGDRIAVRRISDSLLKKKSDGKAD